MTWEWGSFTIGGIWVMILEGQFANLWITIVTSWLAGNSSSQHFGGILSSNLPLRKLRKCCHVFSNQFLLLSSAIFWQMRHKHTHRECACVCLCFCAYIHLDTTYRIFCIGYIIYNIYKIIFSVRKNNLPIEVYGYAAASIGWSAVECAKEGLKST